MSSAPFILSKLVPYSVVVGKVVDVDFYSVLRGHRFREIDLLILHHFDELIPVLMSSHDDRERRMVDFSYDWTGMS